MALSAVRVGWPWVLDEWDVVPWATRRACGWTTTPSPPWLGPRAAFPPYEASPTAAVVIPEPALPCQLPPVHQDYWDDKVIAVIKGRRWRDFAPCAP